MNQLELVIRRNDPSYVSYATRRSRRTNTCNNIFAHTKQRSGNVRFVTNCSRPRNISGNTLDFTRVIFILIKFYFNIFLKENVSTEMWNCFSGETPYSCDLCSKTFTFQQSYHKHLLYHSDERPYGCDDCGRRFKELSTLHNHQRVNSFKSFNSVRIIQWFTRRYTRERSPFSVKRAGRRFVNECRTSSINEYTQEHCPMSARIVANPFDTKFEAFVFFLNFY